MEQRTGWGCGGTQDTQLLELSVNRDFTAGAKRPEKCKKDSDLQEKQLMKPNREQSVSPSSLRQAFCCFTFLNVICKSLLVAGCRTERTHSRVCSRKKGGRTALTFCHPGGSHTQWHPTSQLSKSVFTEGAQGTYHRMWVRRPSTSSGQECF